MNLKYKLAIFDLDGTLAATGPQIALAVQDALKLNDLPYPSVEEIKHYIGNGADALIKRSIINRYEYEDVQFDNDVLQAVKDSYRDTYMQGIGTNFTLFPGVYDTLECLHSSGVKLALATNKPNIYLAPWIHAANLISFFDYAIGSGVIPQTKPHPAILHKVCQELSIDPKDSMMVGDTCFDILAAQAAGMCAVGVTYGYNYLKPLTEYHPDYVLDDFSELQKIILE